MVWCIVLTQIINVMNMLTEIMNLTYFFAQKVTLTPFYKDLIVHINYAVMVILCVMCADLYCLNYVDVDLKNCNR